MPAALSTVLSAVFLETDPVRIIDSALVTEVLDLVKSCAGLFSIFPINVFMIGSLAAMGFRLFHKAKRVAVS